MSSFERIGGTIINNTNNINIILDTVTLANIGIGTTSPLSRLHVYYTGTTHNILRVDDEPNDNTPFIIDQNGNIGIGTTLSRQKLDVIGNIITTTSIGIGTTIPRDTLDVVGEIIVTQNIGIGTTIPTSRLTIAGGTNTIAPISFTSGTNLTNPDAGSMEYDGTNFYITPNTNYGRSTIPATTYTSGTGTAGILANTDYPIFPGTQDLITLSIGTYLASFRLSIANNATTSASLAINIRGAGNAVGTYTWRGTSTIAASGAASAFAVAATALGTRIQVTNAVAASRTHIVIGDGILKITTAGTIVPSYQWSANIVNGLTTLAAGNHMILQTLDTQSAAAYGPVGTGWQQFP